MRTTVLTTAGACCVLALLPGAGQARPASRAGSEAAVLHAVAARGLPASRVEVTAVRHTALGRHVRGVETRGGVPVEGTGWVVTSRGGRIVDVAVDRSRLRGGPSRRVVARSVATRAAAAALGAFRPERVDVERMLVQRGRRLADTYRVTVLSLRPAVAAAVDVDARTGRVAAVRHTERYADVPAKLFDPNPIVTTKNAKLRQPLEQGLPADADIDSADLTAARRPMTLRGLDGTALATGRLVGPWVNVLGIAGYNTALATGSLDLTRMDPRFEGAMAYAHLDAIQRYFQETLALKNVNAEQQEVIATRVEGFDNSFYQPSNDLMLLGTGGVDDGEDAEVIIHEYGHAIHDAQVKGWGQRAEGGAMGEGFGDFLAAAYYAKTSEGFGDTCIMDWDATSYSSADPPCLRRADTKKRYPKDLKNQVHADGELWSAFLWRVRSRLGTTPDEMSDNVIKLVLTSHELLTPQAVFGDAVGALRKAAPALGHPEWVAIIEQEARTTGFPLGGQAP